MWPAATEERKEERKKKDLEMKQEKEKEKKENWGIHVTENWIFEGSKSNLPHITNIKCIK